MYRLFPFSYNSTIIVEIQNLRNQHIAFQDRPLCPPSPTALFRIWRFWVLLHLILCFCLTSIPLLPLLNNATYLIIFFYYLIISPCFHFKISIIYLHVFSFTDYSWNIWHFLFHKLVRIKRQKLDRSIYSTSISFQFDEIIMYSLNGVRKIEETTPFLLFKRYDRTY